MRGARMVAALLKGANLEKCDLSAANVSGADLREANLEKCIVEDASFDDVNLDQANLEGLRGRPKRRGEGEPYR